VRTTRITRNSDKTAQGVEWYKELSGPGSSIGAGWDRSSMSRGGHTG